MKRLAALVVLLLLGLAAPATALDPGPRYFRFNDYNDQPFSALYPGSGVTFSAGSECEGSVVTSHDHPTPYAQSCSIIRILFDEPQRRVSLKVATRCCESSNEAYFRAYRRVQEGNALVDEAERGVPPPNDNFDFAARTVRDPNGKTTIDFVEISTDYQALSIDDVAISRFAQPDTEITSGPADPTSSSTASFDVTSNSATPRFWCRLDDPSGRLATCPSPITYSGLKEGTHTLEVASVDEYGVIDHTPDSHTWRIDQTAPGTTISGGPPAATGEPTATFAFGSEETDVARFECLLDGAPGSVPETCNSPKAYTVQPGQHTFTVRAVDFAGNTGAGASRSWTVSAPPQASTPPIPPPPDRDLDAILDAVDNCPDAANADQADEDGDKIGNACELLPSGSVAPVAGSTTQVSVVSGEVFVKLPAGASVAFRNLRTPRMLFLEDGFVPLKGVASVPIGSTVDTQRGQISMRSALNTRPVGDKRRKLQTAVFAAGIFRLRQADKRGKASSKKIPTDLVLATATGADRVCVGSKTPSKTVVRTLSGSGKGLFRTVGGASTTTARNATWITSDRCNGTRTEVGRGKVKVRDKKRRKTVTVRPGQAYFAKKRLFGGLKGRPSAARGLTARDGR